MKPIFYSFALLLFPALAIAQFNTPTVNGTIGSGEYGTHTNGQNQETNGGQVWYMTWDNTNLYIGITGANTAEGAVIYIDKDPQSPINSGTNSNGTNVGFNYDGTSFAELQFRADIVLYVKSGYREYRTSDGSNGWSSQTTGFGSYSDSGSNREFSLPWSAIGGRPTSFAWFGYLTSSGGSVYGRVPTQNLNTGTSARDERYYIINSTSDGSSTQPFSRNSYVFNRTSDASGFGAIDVYDFTMNTSGRSITRGTGAWTITNDLIIGAGTVSFGSTASSATITRNLTNSGTLTLSSAVGGDLNIGGNFTQDGTFNCNQRAVQFNGTTEQTISGSDAVTIDFFNMNNTAGVTLGRDVTVDDQLALNNGKITLNGFTLTMNDNFSPPLTGESSSKYVITNGVGVLKRNNVSSTAKVFPVGPSSSSYNPVTITNTGTSDNFSVRVGTSVTSPSNANQVVNREWDISEDVSSGSIVMLAFTWNSGEGAMSFSPGGSVVIGHRSGGVWTETTASVTGSGPWTATASGFTSFSPFAVANAGALPVELVYFKGRSLGRVIDLTWSTATELNNSHFDIERSADSRTWETIGTVQGHGTTLEPQQYSYTDRQPLPGLNYYRLRQVDYDGQFEYSKVVSIDFKNGTRPGAVSPNPVGSELFLTLPEETDGPVSVTVFDLSGRVWQQKDLQHNSLDVRGLPAGLYFLQLMTDNGRVLLRERFVKE